MNIPKLRAGAVLDSVQRWLGLKMPKVFVDTNAFLGFFAYSSDDLEQLKKLVDEMKAGKAELLLTDQVQQEFKRNRENKISEALRNFGEKGVADNFPRLIQHYPDFEKLREAAKNYANLKANILTALNKEVVSRELPADLVFGEISKVAKIIDTTPEALRRAHLRMAIGNPPGKKGSLGDAINWELLLESCPNSDLYIVTQDKDYLSPLDKRRFNEFLAEEWSHRCGGKVNLFENLRDLFKEIAPEIKLSVATASAAANAVAVSASDAVVDNVERRVRNLERSGSFANTHAAISVMPESWEMSDEQTQRLFRASVENEQIWWINSDADVLAFFSTLYETAKDQMPTDISERFAELYLAK